MEEGSKGVPVEITVETEIEEDIQRLLAEQTRVDERTFDLQGKYNEQQKIADESGDAHDQNIADGFHRSLVSAQNRGLDISEKLQQLRHPSEFAARVAKAESQQTRIHKLRTGGNRMAKETAKDQGVPEIYLNETGNFKIGMDARLKSDLVNSALGLITTDNPGASLQVFDKETAEALLAKRDWTSFLDRKREIEDAKAEKKKAAAEKKEAEARERAAAKEQKEKEKAQEKEAKAAEKQAADAEKAASADSDDDKPKSGGKAKSGSKTAAMREQREAAAAK